LFPSGNAAREAINSETARPSLRECSLDLDRKSIEPIALRYEVGVRGMQLFMENSPFADARMTQIYQNKLPPRVNDPEGMLKRRQHGVC
jgi:hypothetical protein